MGGPGHRDGRHLGRRDYIHESNLGAVDCKSDRFLENEGTELKKNVDQDTSHTLVAFLKAGEEACGILVAVGASIDTEHDKLPESIRGEDISKDALST